MTAVLLATSTSPSASVSEASPVGRVRVGPRPWPARLRDPVRFLAPAVCGCSPAGTLPEGCDEAGRCPCRPEFDGPRCDRCRQGHHGYPDCHGEQWAGVGSAPGGGPHPQVPEPESFAACACDPRGALDQLCGAGGLCRCRPGYAGATCQECSPGFHGFPDCARECLLGAGGWQPHHVLVPIPCPRPQPATAPPKAPCTQPATPGAVSAAAAPE